MSISISAIFKDDAAMSLLSRLEQVVLNPPLAEAAEAVRDVLLDAVRERAPGADYPSQLTAALTGGGNSVTLNVTGPEPLSDWILHGTPPHDIAPSSAGALFWPGADHPVRLVHHPGTAPNDFVSGALDDALGPITDALAAHLLEAIRG